MDTFEEMLARDRAAVERYTRSRVGDPSDAEDVMQEVYLSAYQKFSQLKNRAAFKAWLISIAKNKCNDYYRRKAAQQEVALEELAGSPDSYHGPGEPSAVQETLAAMGERDRQILYLYFWEELPQAQIAQRLGIPVGTVKSRLHTAKRNFKTHYPYPADPLKGENIMKRFPETIPEYTIEKSASAPFTVKWEELMGWFLVPRLGEKLSWAMYEIPSCRCSRMFHMEVIGRAKVHGIEGVELTAKEVPSIDKTDVVYRTFVAQLTDTHCRYLATLRNDGDVKNYITFLDGEEFLPNWGFGENNCGNQIHIAPKGDIQKDGVMVTAVDKPFLLDIVGRYDVTICGKCYDTVCVMDVETYDCGAVTEHYLDREGHTVLCRRFDRSDGSGDGLTVNGLLYAHRFDCITDRIL